MHYTVYILLQLKSEHIFFHDLFSAAAGFIFCVHPNAKPVSSFYNNSVLVSFQRHAWFAPFFAERTCFYFSQMAWATGPVTYFISAKYLFN